MFLDNFKEPFALQNHGIRLPEFKLQDEDYNKYNISIGNLIFIRIKSMRRLKYTKTKILVLYLTNNRILYYTVLKNDTKDKI